MIKISFVLPVSVTPMKSKLALYPCVKFSRYSYCDLALNDDFSKEPIIFEKIQISGPIFFDLEPKWGQGSNFIVVSVISEENFLELSSTLLCGFFSATQEEIVSKGCRFVRNTQDFFLSSEEPLNTVSYTHLTLPTIYSV